MSKITNKVNFSIKMKPISVNSTYYANKNHGMRPEAKEAQYKIFNAIDANKDKFAEIRSAFNPKKHGYSVKLIFNLVGLYNKQGLPSSGVCDLSNIEKLIVDCVFLSKFHGTNVPYSAPNLNIDDKYLLELSSKKLPSCDYDFVDIEIGLIEQPKL